MLISSFFDFVLTPFQSLPPFWAVCALSLATALLILVVFRFTSNPERIKETKNCIKAHVLEMWLFRDNPRIILTAQWRIVRLNGRYLKLTGGPMLVMLLPLSVMFFAVDGWFSYRPMRPGEQTIVSLWVGEKWQDLLETAALEANGGIAVETPPLRIPVANQVDWRIRAMQAGVHKMSVNLAGHLLEKQLIVSQNLARISPSRVRSELWQNLLYYGEPPVPSELGIERLNVLYPSRSIRVFHWDIHWMLCFIALSFIFVFALKRPFGIEL
jgi:hypothetical protein